MTANTERCPECGSAAWSARVKNCVRCGHADTRAQMRATLDKLDRLQAAGNDIVAHLEARSASLTESADKLRALAEAVGASRLSHGA